MRVVREMRKYIKSVWKRKRDTRTEGNTKPLDAGLLLVGGMNICIGAIYIHTATKMG
jgi:hypothetical protein